MERECRNPPAVFLNQGPMLIKKPTDIPSSEITDERLFLRRREFMQLGVGLVGAAAGGVLAACGKQRARRGLVRRAGERAAADPDRQHHQEDGDDDRAAEQVRGNHRLQQLLRVRHRQERPGEVRRTAQDQPVDGEDRRPLQQARRLPPRGSDQDGRSRGAGLPLPLRRGLVDGDPVGRHPARRRDQARRSDGEGHVRRDADRAAPDRDARPRRRAA